MHPYIRGIKRKNWKLEDGKWVNYGEFTYNDKKKEIIITDLPYDIEFAKFEKLLNKFMLNEALRALNDCDLHLYLATANDDISHYEKFLRLLQEKQEERTLSSIQ